LRSRELGPRSAVVFFVFLVATRLKLDLDLGLSLCFAAGAVAAERRAGAGGQRRWGLHCCGGKKSEGSVSMKKDGRVGSCTSLAVDMEEEAQQLARLPSATKNLGLRTSFLGRDQSRRLGVSQASVGRAVEKLRQAACTLSGSTPCIFTLDMFFTLDREPRTRPRKPLAPGLASAEKRERQV